MLEKELVEADFTAPTVLLRVNELYREGMSEAELYEVTRGYWVMKPEKAMQAQYVMPVFRGKILDVFVPDKWLPAGSTPRTIAKEDEDTEGRLEFTGKYAPDDVRNKYKDQSVKELYTNLN